MKAYAITFKDKLQYDMHGELRETYKFKSQAKEALIEYDDELCKIVKLKIEVE